MTSVPTKSAIRRNEEQPLYILLFSAFPNLRSSWGRLDLNQLGELIDVTPRNLNAAIADSTISKKLAKKLHEAAPDKLPIAALMPFLMPKL